MNISRAIVSISERGRQSVTMGSQNVGEGSEPREGAMAAAGSHSVRVQESLWNEVLSLASYVHSALRTSVEALCAARPELIAGVRAEEKEIDRWEVRIEQECLRVLALYGLVASDLRRVVSALRVNRDLE